MSTGKRKIGMLFLLAVMSLTIFFPILAAAHDAPDIKLERTFAADPIKIKPIPIEINPKVIQQPNDFEPIMRPTTVPTVIGGDGHTVALKSDGTVWAWGDNGYGQLGIGTFDNGSSVPMQVSNLSDVVAIAAAGGRSFLKTGHTVALKSDGTVWTWGHNENGQLGIGTFDKGSTVPVQVQNLSDVVAISAGALHTIALKSDGTVWTWGYNYYGQLGNGVISNGSSVPVQVSNLSGVVAISAQYLNSSALKRDGTVWTWGANFFGQLGYDTGKKNNPTPKQVPKVNGIVSIAQGEYFTCVLGSNGTVWNWGLNYFGSLGNGTSGQQTAFFDPQQVLYNMNPNRALNSAVSISAGSGHTLALLSDGTVWGWGNNEFGQLGNGNFTSRPLATKLDLNGVFTAVGTGKNHSMVIRNDGTVWTWGDNGSYRLGYKTPPPEPAEGSTNVPRQVPELVVSKFLTSIGLDSEAYTLTTSSNHQIKVTATYSDKSILHVTNQAKYQSSKPEVATVNSAGVISALHSGQSNLTATFLDQSVMATVTVQEPTFSDITEHWAKANIIRAVELHLTKGYPDGTFRPDGNVTRAEFAVLLVNALKPSSEGAVLTFKDKQTIGSWAAREIALCTELDIINGYPDNTFRPNKTISHAEMITMVVRAANLPVADDAATDYQDDVDIPKYARSKAAAARLYGITSYITNNRFAPNEPSTRAESVTAIVNMLKVMKEAAKP
ncbi:S-layer homology domain-containing protein [Brevibacillus reuszeri]|uniref:RCC1 domain-containing protein n=1 Tax=Brevibacillus reuszeri TaxID=54915 RepID=UPI0009FD9A5F|nr:S-layer homology domain-containing protein [Brevibacillus reuszeri]MED1861450.1 S-layer homology domain-containing protein [Brevibacillus reuszeri]